MTPERAESHLELWDGLDGHRATLINLSENHTFRLDGQNGACAILRVHRPTYHEKAAIESELAWMRALRDEAGVTTPIALAGRNGALVQTLDAPDDASRYAVLFAFEEGAEPREQDDLAGPFFQLGVLAARCHAHVMNWKRPEGFVRPVWDDAAIMDPDGPWGDWRKAPNMSNADRAVLDRLDDQLRADFSQYGRGVDRFGLVHADMRLANLLVHEGETRLLDFDDCGFSWFAYDFGAAVSFFEDSPQVPELKARWIEGYTSVRPLSESDRSALDAAVLLRRMALLAWIGSHSETELAQSHAADFAENSARLASGWLTRRG